MPPDTTTRTRLQKWSDYRDRINTIYSACWDCERPCDACRQWARETAFGRVPTGDYADACEDTYRMVKGTYEGPALCIHVSSTTTRTGR